MGANYDMMIVRSLHQESVIRSLDLFLATRGMAVTGVIAVADASRERTDDLVFVGPDRYAPWIPLACVAQNMKITSEQWFGTNPLAVHISHSLGPVIFLWSLDSGMASGYGVYENGTLAESRTAFGHSASKEILHPGVPTPPNIKGDRLKVYLNDPFFDYEKYSLGSVSLEDATAGLAARFGLDVHLIDACSVAEEEPSVAIANGVRRWVRLDDWVAVKYAPGKLSNDPAL